MVENGEIFNRVSKVVRTVLASSLLFGAFLPQRAFAQEDDQMPEVVSPSRELLYEYPIEIEQGSIYVNVLRICREDNTGEMQTLIRVSELNTKTSLSLVARRGGNNREVESVELVHDPKVGTPENYRMRGPTLEMNQNYTLALEVGSKRAERWSLSVKHVCKAAAASPVEYERIIVEEEQVVEDQEVAS